jgi:hypothetical protein
MSSELRIDVVVNSTATPDAIWALLADIDTWDDWGPWSSTGLERPGSPEPAGIGAVRRFKYFGRVTREEVVGFDPPVRFAYDLLSGLPLRNYHSEVTVTPTDEGARLEWHSRFDATLAGRMWRPGLARFVRNVATRLTRAAEAG